MFLLNCLLAILNSEQEYSQPAPPAYRWSVGTGLGLHRYPTRWPASGNATVIGLGPLKLDVAYQFTSRLSGQVSALYGHRNINYVIRNTSSSGASLETRTYVESWRTALPLILRYNLSRKPSRRLQTELVAGIALARGRYVSELEETEDGQTTLYVQSNQRLAGRYLTGGVGLRYALGRQRHVEVVADALVNRPTQRYSKGFYQFLDAPLGVTRAYSVGLRYRFKKLEVPGPLTP